MTMNSQNKSAILSMIIFFCSLGMVIFLQCNPERKTDTLNENNSTYAKRVTVAEGTIEFKTKDEIKISNFFVKNADIFSNLNVGDYVYIHVTDYAKYLTSDGSFNLLTRKKFTGVPSNIKEGKYDKDLYIIPQRLNNDEMLTLASNSLSYEEDMKENGVHIDYGLNITKEQKEVLPSKIQQKVTYVAKPSQGVKTLLILLAVLVVVSFLYALFLLLLL